MKGVVLKMKKIPVLVLIAVLMLQCTIFAEEGTRRNTERYQPAVNKVLALGIMDGHLESETNEFMPEADMTRVEFAVAIAKAMGYSEELLQEDQSTPFIDVSESHWASGFINAALTAGVIQKSAAEFRPESPILYEEAVSMLLHATGYWAYAEKKGGYPSGYFAVADQIGLTKKLNLSRSDVVSRAEAAQLLSAACDIDVLEPTSMAGDKTAYAVQSGTTIISKGLSVYKDSGRVTATDFTSVNGTKTMADNHVEINAAHYAAGETAIAHALGYYVDFYYRSAEGGGEKTIVYYEVSEKDNEAVTVWTEDIIDAADGRLTYDSGKSQKTIRIAENANVIYNGKYQCKAVNLNYADMKPQNGNVVCIDSDGDNAYDIIMIHAYDTYVVENVLSAKGIIYDQDDDKEPIRLEDSHVRYSLEKNGKLIEVDDLRRWNVVTVEVSRDKTVYFLTVSDAKVTGKAQSYDDRYITIDETTYELNQNRFGKSTAGLSLKEGTFYLDSFGRVAGCDYAAATGQYAYIAGVKRVSELGETLSFKLFEVSGEFKVYSGAKQITVDGYVLKKAEEVKKALAKSGVDPQDELAAGVCQLIRFDVNAQNEIRWIDTVQENRNPKETDLTCFAPKGSRARGGSYWFFGSTDIDVTRFTMTNSTIVFDIPTDKTNTADYGVKDKGFFPLDKAYDIEAYDAKNLGEASVCLINTGGAASVGGYKESDDFLMLVSGKKEALNQDGDPAPALSVIQSGKEILYYTSDKMKLQLLRDPTTPITLDDINPGDVVYIEADRYNSITYLYKIFPIDKSTSVTDSEDYVYRLGSYYEKVFGYAKKKSGSAFMLSVNGKDVYFYTDSNTRYYKFDMVKKKAYKGSLNDMVASSVKDYATKVFVRVRNGEVKDVFMYEW